MARMEAHHTMNNNEILSLWLTLHKSAGVGPRAVALLLDHFGSIENIFTAKRSELQDILANKPSIVDAIRQGPRQEKLTDEFDWLAQTGHSLLTLDDPDYPPLLRELSDAPYLLFLSGSRELLGSTQLAIVGSRNPSPSGVQTTRDFAHTLAQTGFIITSGLAQGIDAAAHQGALSADGFTIAVAGTGIDRVYPKQHRELAHRIVDRGLLLSEFPLGTPPKRENFPLRNRLISGLAVGTLVVEAALRSGSLITARLAGEQGREVFAIPGSIHSPLSRGCHQLIRQGAKLVESAQDVIEELGSLTHFVLSNNTGKTDKKTNITDPEQITLLQHMGFDPVTVDMLVQRSGLTSDRICSMLSQLELSGDVANTHGGHYQRLT